MVSIKQQSWEAHGVLLVAILLQIFLASRFIFGPKYLVAGIEIALLIGVWLTTPSLQEKRKRLRRTLAILLIACISFINIVSIIMVCNALVSGQIHSNGQNVVLSAIVAFITNIIIFGIWYWEMDSPGLSGKVTHTSREPDFLFPQMNLSSRSGVTTDWQPTFGDYLYVSLTNATAFSPTDTQPMTHRAKLLMSVQALASLATVALVIARGVTILN